MTKAPAGKRVFALRLRQRKRLAHHHDRPLSSREPDLPRLSRASHPRLQSFFD
jgi:hypothetical protein